MTIWQPHLNQKLPVYRALADAIACDLQTGRLSVGDRLPTHRDLAEALGVTVGTVSRGYAEAERRGLTVAVVGRGTFIRDPAATNAWPDSFAQEEDVVDLTLSLPVQLPEDGRCLAETLRHISEDPGIGHLLAYQSETAMPHQRKIGAEWLNRLGLGCSTEGVLVTAGSQHGLNVVLSGLFHPGDVLATAALTYPSLKGQARAFGIKLRGIELDEEGICPESLVRACEQEPRPKGLYLVPNLQNPTTGTLSNARRATLAAIAKSFGLWILEDDVHAFLLPNPLAPVATHAPERTVYLSSVAKCLVPGLRTGFLVAPAALTARLRAAIHNSIWMAPPLMVEVTTRWLADGTADRLMAAKRTELEIRRQLAHKILGHHRLRSAPFGYQLWLALPEPWCADAFVADAREAGVKVIGAGAFAVNRHQVPHAVRLSVGSPSRERLKDGLSTLESILGGGSAGPY